MLLATMDDVYALLVTVDYPDAVTGGLRRTTDALRAVIERTRGDLTNALVAARLRAAIESSAPRTIARFTPCSRRLRSGRTGQAGGLDGEADLGARRWSRSWSPAAAVLHLRGGGLGPNLAGAVGAAGCAGRPRRRRRHGRPAATGTPAATTVWLDGQDRARSIATGAAAAALHARRRRGRPGRPLAVRGVAARTTEARDGIAFVDGALRLNQVQALGTHNSYHVDPLPPIDGVEPWQYSHDPLDVQFAVRGHPPDRARRVREPTRGTSRCSTSRTSTSAPRAALVDVPADDQDVVRRAPAAHADRDPARAQGRRHRSAEPAVPPVGRVRPRPARRRDPLGVPAGNRCSRRTTSAGTHATLAEAITHGRLADDRLGARQGACS